MSSSLCDPHTHTTYTQVAQLLQQAVADPSDDHAEAMLNAIHAAGFSLSLTPNADARTALHVAAADGNAKVVEHLLELRADSSPSDRWGRTPLDDAMRFGHPEVVRLLREASMRAWAASTASALQ